MVKTPEIHTKPLGAMLHRHKGDRTPSGELRHLDPTPLELDLKVGAERVQLLLGQVLDGATRWLLAVEELDSQILRTVAGHRLRVCLRKDQRVGPRGLRDSRLRPGGHEDVSGRIAFWV